MAPMPPEQLGRLNDYSNLTGLHVYGNLLDELYNLKVDVPLSIAGRIFKDLRALDRALFTVYVSFVLGKLGYNLRLIADEKHFTSKFEFTDWTSLCELYSDNFAESSESPRWSEDFSTNGSNLRVIFLDSFFTDDVAEIKPLLSSDSRSLVVVHPKTVRQVNKVFLKMKHEFKEQSVRGELISTGEFVALLVPETTQRKMIENEWSAILDDILSTLIRSWPIIGMQQHRQLLEESREYLRLAHAKYEIGQMRDSMRDACLGCEGILTVMIKMYEPRKLDDRPVFSELLENLRPYILPSFGEDVYRDLDFVREWRNRASHVGRDSPEPSDVLKVLTKVELFMNLFERQVLLGSRSA